MSTFTKQELRLAMSLGLGLGLLASGMAVIGQFCLSREIGLPEYIVSLRNTGITLLVLSALWSLLAGWRLFFNP